MMWDDDVKFALGIVLFGLFLLIGVAFYDFSKSVGKQEFLNELCSKTKYDFCVPKQEWDLRK